VRPLDGEGLARLASARANSTKGNTNACGFSSPAARESSTLIWPRNSSRAAIASNVLDDLSTRSIDNIRYLKTDPRFSHRLRGSDAAR